MTTEQTSERDEFRESLLADFIDESSQLLDRLNEQLLDIDEMLLADSDAVVDLHSTACFALLTASKAFRECWGYPTLMA